VEENEGTPAADSTGCLGAEAVGVFADRIQFDGAQAIHILLCNRMVKAARGRMVVGRGRAVAESSSAATDMPVPGGGGESGQAYEKIEIGILQSAARGHGHHRRMRSRAVHERNAGNFCVNTGRWIGLQPDGVPVSQDELVDRAADRWSRQG